MNECAKRIENLRAKMKEAGVDVYYIPMSDCHNSEYVAAHFRCVEYMSGFSGSAANIVVDAEGAWLFTDGRYFIQAAKELEGSGIELMKMGEKGVPELKDFLKEKTEGKILGFDGSVVPASFGKKFDCEIKYDMDLVGDIWEDRPNQDFTDIFELPLECTGESAEDKIKRIREKIEKETKANDYLYIVNSLDDIAWTFNIRANDIQNNPVAYSYAAISRDFVKLYTGAEYKSSAFECLPYSKKCLCIDGFKKVVLDETRISYDTYRFYKDSNAEIINMDNPSTYMKGVKNETEIKCLKEALVMDSAVLVNYMYWLKKNVGKIEMTEVSVADYLEGMRKEQPGFIELSFDTISAYGENAAQMHYDPKPVTCSKIEPKGFLLVDSGGQYMKGTTDITRTFAMGPLTDEEKKAFTLTAASMLRLMNAKFLKGCAGENLDIMARLPMWKEGWDYKCGTGHGVGHILGVHEGPHNIRWKFNHEHPTAVLEPGMVVTDEPGVYREGKFGVRTENELLVKEYMETPDGTFYEFENLTFIPIDIDAIDTAYLSFEDLEFLNDYHKKVYEKISPLVTGEVKEWLKEYTRELK